MRSLRAYLEGNWEECLNAIATAEAAIRRDPEILFYSARHLARINESDRAISALSAAIDCGFLCTSAILRDPWFGSLRSLPLYVELVKRAEQRGRETHAAFLAAGGEQVISVA
jgi:transposase